MTDDKSTNIKKNIQAPSKAQESTSAPERAFIGSQQAPNPTGASITSAKGRPKTD